MNCPFYGRSALAFPILVASHGNQCALWVASYSPCTMETQRKLDPDWRNCTVLFGSSFYPEAELLSPGTGRHP
jgi:hypothetical protein